METFNTGAETFNASWVEAYTELAKKLLPFKNNRQALIAIIKEVYAEINIKLPTLERDNNIVDIDPFTVFGFFNKNSQTNENRVKILSALSKKIGVGIAALSFEGVPTVNNQNATFYYFIGSRNAEDIDNLWGLFESALKYIGDKSQEARKKFCHFFNLVIGAKGNNNGKITMGLYWVSAREYLNLDSRNQWFIYETDKLPTALTQKLPKVTNKIPAERLGDNDENETHYWLYAPGRNAENWGQFKSDGIMAIGWGQIGDLSDFPDKASMKAKMKELYGSLY